MQSIVALLAFVAVASAGVVGPAVYSAGYAQPLAYAQPAVAYAHAPVIAKHVVPSAQSSSYINRAPAARVAVAAPVAYATPVQQVAYATPVQQYASYAAPSYASTYSVRAPKALVAHAPAFASYASPAYAGVAHGPAFY